MPTFILEILFPGQRQAGGPEARALRAKNIGGKRIPLGDPSAPPQNEAGPSGAAKLRIRNSLLIFAIPHSALHIPHFHCPPGPATEARLMVFARNVLASGPGNALILIHRKATWQKLKVGKESPGRMPAGGLMPRAAVFREPGDPSRGAWDPIPAACPALSPSSRRDKMRI